MNNFNFRYYGKLNVKGIQEKLTAANLDWDEFSFRQERHKHHRETKTIPLVFNEENLFKPKYWDNYKIFSHEIDYVRLLIEKTNMGGVSCIRQY